MKKFSIISVVFVFCFFAVFAIAKHFWRGETLPTKQVEKKWGSLAFDEKGFREGNLNLRAKMAASLLKQ